MKRMSLHEELVAELIPQIYATSVREFRYPEGYDMSRSVKCHTLTMDLWRAMGQRGVQTRREFHYDEKEGFWHYVINHGSGTSDEPDILTMPPSEHDIITDINPWSYYGGELHSGFLHGSRAEIQEHLRHANAPDEHIAMRGLATIAAAHCESIVPQIF